MPDDDDLGEAQAFADEGDVVGEALHGVGLARLVACPMAAEVDADDPAPRFREMFELGGEKVVVAAPAMDEHHRSARAARLLEK